MAAILLTTGLCACGQASEGDKELPARSQAAGDAPAIGELNRDHAGTPAPEAVLDAAGGSQVRLGDFIGTPTLVNLWATWCAPCIAEMPALDRLAAREAGALRVVAVSQDLRGWPVVTPFVKKAGFPHIVVLSDARGALGSALKAAGLPMSVLYDAAGREVWRVNGPRAWDRPGGFQPPKPKPTDPWSAARARGVAFRAVGNEPGWYLELTPGGEVDVVADYGERRVSLPAPATFRPDAARALALSSSGHSLALGVTPAACSDGMSDARYPYAVTMTLDGTSYRGCGRDLIGDP